MIDTKTNETLSQALHGGVIHPLKSLNAEQFAALGGNRVVFTRMISGAELTPIVPEASDMPEDAIFHLVMAANGAPMMVSDNLEALNGWLGENEVEVAQRH